MSISEVISNTFDYESPLFRQRQNVLDSTGRKPVSTKWLCEWISAFADMMKGTLDMAVFFPTKEH